MTNTLIFLDSQLNDLTEATLEMEGRLKDGDYSLDDQQCAVIYFPLVLYRLHLLSEYAEGVKRNRHFERYGPGGCKARGPNKKRTTRLKLVVRNPDPPQAA